MPKSPDENCAAVEDSVRSGLDPAKSLSIIAALFTCSSLSPIASAREFRGTLALGLETVEMSEDIALGTLIVEELFLELFAFSSLATFEPWVGMTISVGLVSGRRQS